MFFRAARDLSTHTNKNHRRPGGKFYQLGGNSASEDLVPLLPATDGISRGGNA